MQLYKSRSFGEFFQATFAFIKQNGTHLFKNFFVINGIFLLILMVIAYFFGKFYSDLLFGGLNSNSGVVIDAYMNDNAFVIGLLFILFIVVGIVSASIAYAYVPLYLQLYAKHDGKNFGASELIDSYKNNIGKLITFILCSILVAIPLVLFAGLIGFVLLITIIGALALPLLAGGLTLFYQGTLMEYFASKKSIWQSFGYSWKLMSSKFWPAIGCVGLFYLMAYVVQNVVTLVPYFAFIVDMMTSVQTDSAPDPGEFQKSFMLLLAVIFVLNFLVSTLLNVVVQLNQGIVFYSLKEDNENIHTKSDIDLIGSGA